ncbi:MAG: hypothetical protein K1Y36_28870 [Blastocatellia bacterium]|nr:hypothetical protein [Blastocatellia bacterium]
MGIALFLVWLGTVFGVLFLASKIRSSDVQPLPPKEKPDPQAWIRKRHQPWLPHLTGSAEQPRELSIWTRFDEDLINDDQYLLNISQQLSRNGAFHLARIVLDRITNQFLQHEARLVLAYELTKRQDLLAGESTATAIPDDELTEPLLVLVARTFLCAVDSCLLNGENLWAKSYLEKAIGYVERLPADNLEKADCFQFIGDCWFLLKDENAAFAAWKQAALLAQALYLAADTSERERASCLSIVVHVAGELIQHNVVELPTKKILFELTRPKKREELMKYPFAELVLSPVAIESPVPPV